MSNGADDMSMSGHYEDLFERYGYPRSSDPGWVGDLDHPCGQCQWPMHLMFNTYDCANCKGDIPGKHKKLRFDTQPLFYLSCGKKFNFNPKNRFDWLTCLRLWRGCKGYSQDPAIDSEYASAMAKASIGYSSTVEDNIQLFINEGVLFSE